MARKKKCTLCGGSGVVMAVTGGKGKNQVLEGQQTFCLNCDGAGNL